MKQFTSSLLLTVLFSTAALSATQSQLDLTNLKDFDLYPQTLVVGDSLELLMNTLSSDTLVETTCDSIQIEGSSQSKIFGLSALSRQSLKVPSKKNKAKLIATSEGSCEVSFTLKFTSTLIKSLGLTKNRENKATFSIIVNVENPPAAPETNTDESTDAVIDSNNDQIVAQELTDSILP
eukprot:403345744